MLKRVQRFLLEHPGSMYDWSSLAGEPNKGLTSFLPRCRISTNTVRQRRLISPTQKFHGND
jgi:hypothetical protein